MKRSFRTDNAPLLKDYLLDDLNCSSSSFKSFPRTHCCTTVRFLVHEDLKSTKFTNNNVHKSRPRTTMASTAISALQKASEAVLNAVKLLSVPKQSSVKSGFLSRSFSRKLFKRTFWKKNVDEIHRWKIFHNLVSDFPETPSHCIPTPTTATTAVTVTTSFTQSTTIDDEDSKSSCCSDSEMSSEYVQSCRREEVSVKESRDRSGDEPGKDSNEPVEKQKDWMATNEKEQFSPVSILECPFDAEDRDDNVSSPDLDPKLVGMEGTRKRLMETLSRFEALVEMEPIDLDERLAALSDSEGSENNDITNLDSEKAQNMLELVKSRIMPAQFETRSVFFADSLLLDFFMESLKNETDHDLIEAAEGYLTGQGRKMVSDWRVEESRKWYLKEMEMGGNWKDFEQQRVELVMEIEGSIWSSLVNDLMNELNY